MIHYRDEVVTVHHADALEVLPALPDGSVDAIVTDPPYGLEFMGKDWDSFGRGDARSNATAGMTGMGYTDGGNRLAQPTFLGGLNPRCRTCGRSQRGAQRSICHCDRPDFTDERGPRLRAFQEWCGQWAAECLRVLKPGGHLLAFGGTRTWHRLTCAIEDAGFEIRDTITWLYGSGFPKSLDVSKAIDNAAGAEREVVGRHPTPAANRPGGAALMMSVVGMPSDVNITAPATDDARRWQGWGTALKPASEPIVVARKPLAGTVAANVLTHGTGALNIDGCRIGSDERTYRARGMKCLVDQHSAHDRPYTKGIPTRGEPEVTVTGRWPTNVILSHPGNDTDGDLCANGCIPGCPVAELDAQSGVLTSGVLRAHHARQPKDAGILGAYGSAEGERGYGDRGGASRFFPTFRYEAKAPTAQRPRADGTAHPTVKPLDLMRWLVRLVTPPGGLVLDPFAGSGTTGEACIVEGFRCVLIERDATYLPLINARVSKPIQPVLDLFGGSP